MRRCIAPRFATTISLLAASKGSAAYRWCSDSETPDKPAAGGKKKAKKSKGSTTGATTEGGDDAAETPTPPAAAPAPETPAVNDAAAAPTPVRDMLPKQLMGELDKFIVGQSDAKRAVAVALRNRWRRHQVEPVEMRDEISPKNILMIGPTGVGKTEIARRLAKLTDAPFVKVEATKFTEVGFHGRDVDSIIEDLLKVSISQTKQVLMRRHEE